MRWPPVKSWTSSLPIKGFRHFVAINYGGKGIDRWVILVAVLDGKASLRILWSEMNDGSKWSTGWLEVNRVNANSLVDKTRDDKTDTTIEDQTCLHPSEDSGLLVPTNIISPRPWNLKKK